MFINYERLCKTKEYEGKIRATRVENNIRTTKSSGKSIREAVPWQRQTFVIRWRKKVKEKKRRKVCKSYGARVLFSYLQVYHPATWFCSQYWIYIGRVRLLYSCIILYYIGVHATLWKLETLAVNFLPYLHVFCIYIAWVGIQQIVCK